MRFCKLAALTLAAALWTSAAPPVLAQTSAPVILSMRERADVTDRWLKHRLDTLLPELMRRADVEMWIIVAREYNEDPVIETMLPATWLSARRRTILVFYDQGPDKGVERMAVARYAIGDVFESAWDPETQPDQWQRLAEIVAERDPASIALNRSETFGLADGLTYTEGEALLDVLPEKYRERIVSGEDLAVGWLERRTDEEMDVYPMIVRIAHEIIAEGFSEAVIQPGVTTTEDVQWWYRERIRDLNLVTWFHPSVSIQRADSGDERDNDFSSRPEGDVIRPGDLLHVDFGIKYLGLNTDTQQHAYVLHPGETEAPQGLRDALAVGNQLQDALTNQFQAGRTGNELLKGALDEAQAEGIEATIYTHPIGFHGHAAGPTIGLWDQQGGVPGKGDYPLYPKTAYSIELNAAVPVAEWDGKKIRVMLEEDAFFDGENTRYIDGRQTELLLIPRRPAMP